LEERERRRGHGVPSGRFKEGRRKGERKMVDDYAHEGGKKV